MSLNKSETSIGKIEIQKYPKRAVYPGTFDPPTNGHIDVAKRASVIFDEVIVAVSANPDKKPLFSVKERVEMLETLFKDDKNIIVKSLDGLLASFVASENATAIVRGLRAVSDFDYELQLASTNSLLNKSAETIFFMSSDENLFVSSSMIKEIAKLGGDISQKVHPLVWEKVKKKFFS
jgi:pantetheine-phosphate adenylyltransferase